MLHFIDSFQIVHFNTAECGFLMYFKQILNRNSYEIAFVCMKVFIFKQIFLQIESSSLAQQLCNIHEVNNNKFLLSAFMVRWILWCADFAFHSDGFAIFKNKDWCCDAFGMMIFVWNDKKWVSLCYRSRKFCP